MTGEQNRISLTRSNQNSQQQVALNAAGLGTWEIDLRNGQCWWDVCCRELFGVPTSDAYVSTETVMDLLHPEDRTRIQELLQKPLPGAAEQSYDVVFRLDNQLGEQTRRLRTKGRVYCNSDGTIERLSGIIDAVAAQNSNSSGVAELQFQQLVEQAPVAMALFKGADFRVSLANERMLTLWSRSMKTL